MKEFVNMYVETEELVETINKYIRTINSLDEESKVNYYPLAFFAIFVKFQKLVYNQFERYCLGQCSSANYCPKRKHCFADEKELRHFLGSKKREYIDYDDRIEILSSHIFIDNPFDNLFCLIPQSYNNLKKIRNYIAHESDISKGKLIESKILDDSGDISIYFAQKSKKSIIHFNEIIKSLYDYSNYILEGN